MDWLLISHENKVGCFCVHLVFSGCSQILAQIIASIPLDLPACKFYNFLVLIKSKLYCKYKRLWVKSSNASMLITVLSCSTSFAILGAEGEACTIGDEAPFHILPINEY